MSAERIYLYGSGPVKHILRQKVVRDTALDSRSTWHIAFCGIGGDPEGRFAISLRERLRTLPVCKRCDLYAAKAGR